MKYFLCEVCGNLVGLINEGGGELVCCGEPMKELKPKSTEEGTEKHLPVVTKDGNKIKVNVGSIPHPMTAEHHIDWISLVYNNKMEIAKLDPTASPEATFDIDGDFEYIEVYAYCNIHGLWKIKIESL